MKSPVRYLQAGALSLVLWSSALGAPAVGQPAPDFSLTDLQGRTHRLADFRERIVVLEWVNPECPFVRKHYEGSDNMPATQRAALAEGAVWVTINSGHEGAQGDFSPAEVVAWQRRTGAVSTVYLRDPSGRVGRLYDARHTPTLFIVSPEGTLVYAGGIDDIGTANPGDIVRANNYVKAALADLLAGRPVAKAVTRAYGCNIKYAD